MKNERFRIRAGLMAALALLVHHGGDIGQAKAQTQDPIWSSGNTQISFPNWNQVASVQPLPTPTTTSIPQQYRYNGTVAQRSQFAQYDRERNLLFFAVDGNIYNANGYLIADAGSTPGDRNCRVCTFKGNEFHVVPVPGSCSRYYIISLFGVEGGNEEILSNGFAVTSTARSRIRIGVLDLTLMNDFPVYNDPSCPVRGRFLSTYELGVPGINLLQDFDEVDSYGIDGDLVDGDPQYYLTEGSLHTSEVGVGMVHAASIELDNDIRVIMMARTGTRMVPMIITANGVRRLPGSSSQGYYPMEWHQDGDVVHDVQDNDQSFRGEMAIRQVGNELRVAYSSYFDALSSGQLFNENRVTYWRFQLFAPGAPAVLGFTMVPYTSSNPNPRQYATDQTLPNTTDPPLDHLGNVVTRPSICGLEFSPSGQYLYFTKSGRGYEGSYSPNFGYIDVTVQCALPPAVCNAIFFPSTGDPASSRRLVETQLGMNYNSDAQASLYMIGTEPNGSNWLGSFDHPDDPTNGTWHTQELALPSVAYRTPDGGNPQYRLLNHRVANSNHYSKLRAVDCCVDYVTMKDLGRTITTTSTPWNPGDNPFCDANGPVYIANELRIVSGVNVVANDMEFRFGPEARLVIERGATFSSTRCVFTSACERWPGIRLEGNTANTYQDNPNGVGNPNLPRSLEQGWLRLTDNSVVENAWVGVWCAREMENHQPDPDYYGGCMRATNSTFRNCVNGVRVQNYHRFNAGAIELPNQTLIANCSFEINADWPSYAAHWQVRLDNVRHMKITNCSFENSAPQLFPPDETGGGIFLFNATAYVDGNSNPAQSYIKGFYMGVFNASGELNSVRVSKMHFAENVYGIADLQSSMVEYAENNFHVPDIGTAPNPRVGMLLWQTKHFTVEQNSFTGETQEGSVGIFFVGAEVNADGSPAGPWWYEDERIYDNTFKNLQAGNLISGIHRGNKATDVDAGLQLLCGDYTDNMFDIALLERSIVRPNQGQTISGPNQNELAGNRFFSTSNCSSQFDWALDADWNNINTYTSMVINYKRHEFPDDVVGVSCDQWLNPELENEFDDIPVPFSDDFIKATNCAGGVYPIVQSGMGTHQLGYLQAKNLLTAAINTYEGQVDLGDTPDLETALKQDAPYLPSATLRDLLLAKHPLSDDVLALMLKRPLPMDPWHITQVLLQNSKLNPGIWKLAQEQQVLSAFLLGVVGQAQSGTGQTVKQLLEQEIVQRRLEMTSHMNVLGHIYARDTVGIPTDSLIKMLLFDTDKENVIQRLHTLVGLQRYTEAQTLLDGQLNAYTGKQVLQDLMDLQQSVGNDWKTLTGSGKDQLTQLAMEGKAGSPQAAAILLSLGAAAPIPPVHFPNFTKSRRVAAGGRTSDLASDQPALACYPNPSHMSTFVTYPAELDGTNMTLLDAKGALVFTMRLGGHGLLEVDTKNLAEGLYQVVAPGTGLSTKLTVQH